MLLPIHGNMIKVKGEDGHTWIGHVMAVNTHNKICQVYFYIEVDAGVYVREISGRRRIEMVHWDSILGVANGYWKDDKWHCIT